MEILFLSQIVPYPPHGGVLQRGYNLIREIGKYNRVHLVAFHHPDTLPTPEIVTQSIEELKKHCATVEYVELWPKKSKYHFFVCLGLGFFSRSPFSVLAHMSRTYGHKVREILGTRNIDVIHVDTIALTQYANLGRHIPRILTHHNIESKLMARRAPHEANRASRFYIGKQAERLAVYERLTCREFDMNIFMSEIDAAEMRHGIPDLKSTVIPNGVDVKYFQPKEASGDPPSLIYTGGMNMYANKDAVLYFLKKIWSPIRDAIPDSVFYAVGQDPPAELKEIASRDPQVRVTGYVDDVRPYISNACVYVVPLRIGGGTRLKVLDAMAMGKAIVSTSIGCEGIDVSPGKNVIVADDPGSFARGTIDLIRNREKRTNLGSEARKLVESRYSWDGIGRKLQLAYVEIASGKSNSGN